MDTETGREALKQLPCSMKGLKTLVHELQYIFWNHLPVDIPRLARVQISTPP
jgi:hypothetical protein